MENIFKNKTLLVLIVVFVIVAFVFYTYFFKGDNNPTNNTGLLSSQSANAGSALDVELFQLLGKLKKINFDEKKIVFSDNRFVSLVDFSQSLPVIQKGRVNPFAPIGTGGSLVTTTNTKTSAGSQTTTSRTTTPAKTTVTNTVVAPVSEPEPETNFEVIDGSTLE